MTRPQKIIFAELRAQGVHGLLIFCQDYRCSHNITISAEGWATISADLTAHDAWLVSVQQGRDLPLDAEHIDVLRERAKVLRQWMTGWRISRQMIVVVDEPLALFERDEYRTAVQWLAGGSLHVGGWVQDAIRDHEDDGHCFLSARLIAGGGNQTFTNFRFLTRHRPIAQAVARE